MAILPIECRWFSLGDPAPAPSGFHFLPSVYASTLRKTKSLVHRHEAYTYLKHELDSLPAPAPELDFGFARTFIEGTHKTTCGLGLNAAGSR
jgi:hypothetical protein